MFLIFFILFFFIIVNLQRISIDNNEESFLIRNIYNKFFDVSLLLSTKYSIIFCKFLFRLSNYLLLFHTSTINLLFQINVIQQKLKSISVLSLLKFL